MNKYIIQPSNTIIKYIPLQQGLRPSIPILLITNVNIIKYIPLQQGLRLASCYLLWRYSLLLSTRWRN